MSTKEASMITAADIEQLRKARVFRQSMQAIEEMFNDLIDPIVDRALECDNLEFMRNVLNAMPDCDKRNTLSAVYYRRLEKAQSPKLNQAQAPQ